MFFGKNKEELGLEESLAALKAERDTLSEKVQSELHQVKTKINHWQNALAYREKKIESVNNAIAQYNSATAEKKPYLQTSLKS